MEDDDDEWWSWMMMMMIKPRLALSPLKNLHFHCPSNESKNVPAVWELGRFFYGPSQFRFSPLKDRGPTSPLPEKNAIIILFHLMFEPWRMLCEGSRDMCSVIKGCAIRKSVRWDILKPVEEGKKWNEWNLLHMNNEETRTNGRLG